METTLLRTSAVVLSVVGLALTQWSGIGGTASASTPSSPKAERDCPLTDGEKRGGFEVLYVDDALDYYPDTLYAAPGIPLEVGTYSGLFGYRPIGKLTVATKRGPRTVANFCVNRDGSFFVTFPADTITGPATITLSSRKKEWQGVNKPMKRNVFRKTFQVVALDAVPAKPVSPTDIRGEARSDGFYFTWTPMSAQPGIEFYRFACTLPTAVRPEIFTPWSHVNLWVQPGDIFPLTIQSINVAGMSEVKTWWHYDPGSRELTRIG